MDRLGLRARVRAAAGPRRPARGRPRATRRVHDRRRAVRPGQRRLRSRALTDLPRRRPRHPGTGRRPGHATGKRVHPDDVRRRGARQGVRLLRHRGRDLHRDRTAARGSADRAVRHPQRLACGVLRQPPGRRPDADARPALSPRSRAAVRKRAAYRTRSGRRGAARPDRDLHPGAVHRTADMAQPATARAVRGRRRARRPLGPARTPLRPQTTNPWSTWTCSRSAPTCWAPASGSCTSRGSPARSSSSPSTCRSGCTIRHSQPG